MTEYKLLYHWDAGHWTCITASDNSVDICKYIKNNLAEMQEAMEVSEDAYFSIENDTVVWRGTPEELLEVIKEIVESQ